LSELELDQSQAVVARTSLRFDPRTRQLALLAYGVAFALYAALHLVHVLPNDQALMGTRVDGVQASIAVLDRGGPPLLGSKSPYGAPGTVAARDYYPVGVTDDQGLYLYLPVLGKLTGEHDSHVLLKWFFIGCFVLLFAVYPLIFYELMGSVIAAVAAPIIVLHWFAFLRNIDLYWIVGWCILLGLPIVFLAFRRAWDRWSIVLLVVAVLIGSFSTSIRIHSGLPILLSALAVVFLKVRPWRRRIVLFGLLLVVSFSINVGVLDAARIARDETVGIDFRKSYPNQHPFWHNAYIGLGYLPNKYGIKWDDSVAVQAVARVDPHAGYLTPKYEHILRHLWFKLLKHDPRFVLNTLWTKFGVSLDRALKQFGWLWLVVLPVTMLAGRRRHLMRGLIGLTVPALAVNIVPPVLTIPNDAYDAGWIASVGLLWMLVVLWALALIPQAAELVTRAFKQPRATLTEARRDVFGGLPTRRETIVVCLVAAVVLAVSVPAIAHSRGQAKTVSPGLVAAQRWS
jgi:hypothetical protein